MRARTSALVIFAGAAVIAAAACSGGGGGGGGSGSPTPNGNLIRVLDSNGTPLSGIEVVVNDSAGEIVTTKTTASNGTALVQVPATGSVTVLDTDIDGHQAQTVVAPPFGLTIDFRVAATPIPTPTLPSAAFDVTFSAVPASVTGIAWFANCLSFPIVDPSVSLETMAPATDACNQSQTGWTLYAVGRNGGGNLTSWGELIGQPNSFGGTLTTTFPVSNTAFDSVNVGHAALPTPADSDVSLNFLVDSAGALSVAAIPFTTLTHSAAAQSQTAQVPHDGASAWLPIVSVVMSNGNGSSTRLTEDWKTGGTVASDYLLDPTGRGLVSMGGLNVTDPARLTLNWSATSGTLGAAGFLRVVWTTAGAAGRREIVFPSSMDQTFTVPKLPAADSAWLPDGTSTYIAWTVGYDDVDVLATYGAWLSTDRASLSSYDHATTAASVP